MQESEGYIMDKLTVKQKDKMYDEIEYLLFKYDKDRTAKRMIKSFLQEVQEVENSKELCNMQIVSASLNHLLKITFPNK